MEVPKEVLDAIKYEKSSLNIKEDITEYEVPCPYCGGKASFSPTSNFLYRGTDYGPVYVCKCGEGSSKYATVGVHKGTRRPLGRLADSKLKYRKKKAHTHFDKIWKDLIDEGYSKKFARSYSYVVMAYLMGHPKTELHIGELDIYDCDRVVQLIEDNPVKDITRDLINTLKGLSPSIRKSIRLDALFSVVINYSIIN